MIIRVSMITEWVTTYEYQMLYQNAKTSLFDEAGCFYS